MSQLRIQVRFYVADVLTDVTSAVLSDETAAYGVRRTDTGAVVVAAGTALTRVSAGTYEHTFTEPAEGLTYDVAEDLVYQGRHYRRLRQVQGTAADEDLDSYLTVAQAAAIAAAMPTAWVSSFTAASESDQAKALAAATAEIDTAMRYQGQKYGPTIGEEQTLEFPRVTMNDERGAMNNSSFILHPSSFSSVWDWDSATSTVVVPESVKLAVVHQANAILAGKRDERLDARHDGVKSQSGGGLSESYDDGKPATLCRRAELLMAKYRLRSGEMV